MTPPKKYDTIIIGSGIGGTSLAAILARHGKKVLMIEKGRHPRFAIGEAAFFRFETGSPSKPLPMERKSTVSPCWDGTDHPRETQPPEDRRWFGLDP